MSYPNRNWIIEDQRLSVEFAAGMTELNLSSVNVIAEERLRIAGYVYQVKEVTTSMVK